MRCGASTSDGLDGPVERWRELRDEIHDEVCRKGFDEELGAFTQSYGSTRLDASVLMMPLVGFLPVDDPRIVGTVAAIERDLVRDGLVERYRADEENAGVDGLPPGEGTFLPCSFWLVQVLVLQGRLAEAEALFERLLGLRNDLGLLSEEYDVGRRAAGRELPPGVHAPHAGRRRADARRGLVPARRASRSRRDQARGADRSPV